MGIKSLLAKPFAAYIRSKIRNESVNAVAFQKQTFNSIIQQARKTKFGIDHDFSNIKTFNDFQQRVPVRDYEGLRTYIDLSLTGEKNILWPGKPLYWSKTSGTTSGVKYIPISKESIPYHINAARNALLCYIAETGNSSFIDGKLIFLSGSPKLEYKNHIPVGRLSGIVNHHVPKYLRSNQMPSYETNCIEDWEQKVDAIVDETINQNMTLISGIPPWVQMYFDKLLDRSKQKNISELFPNLNLFVYGGVNFEPYRKKIEHSIGKKIHTIETYPASEGFIAFQDSQDDNSLLLLTNNGIFYEFIPLDEVSKPNPKRITLAEIELNKNYAIVLTTNAGLYSYLIGDTIKFVSINPYKILVTGRIKHFISAFGEHVIAEEVEHAILTAANQHNAEITEFTVAPKIMAEKGELSYHEWFIEFAKKPDDMNAFSKTIDESLQQKNIYYRDLIQGAILQPLKITEVPKDTFIRYMKSVGKLGGQNKLARLSNDRNIADKITLLLGT